MKTKICITQISQTFLLSIEHSSLVVQGLEKQVLTKFMHHQPDNDKMYPYTKHPYVPKNELLINKHEQNGIKHFKDLKALIDVDDYNSDKKPKTLIAFDDIITNMLSNKKLELIFTELYLFLSHNYL